LIDNRRRGALPDRCSREHAVVDLPRQVFINNPVIGGNLTEYNPIHDMPRTRASRNQAPPQTPARA